MCLLPQKSSLPGVALRARDCGRRPPSVYRPGPGVNQHQQTTAPAGVISGSEAALAGGRQEGANDEDMGEKEQAKPTGALLLQSIACLGGPSRV